VIERLEVDEFWSVIDIELLQVEEHFVFDVLNQVHVVPQFIEPRPEVPPVAVAVHFQVELDVVIGRA
jgi:hypothetical protein